MSRPEAEMELERRVVGGRLLQRARALRVGLRPGLDDVPPTGGGPRAAG